MSTNADTSTDDSEQNYTNWQEARRVFAHEFNEATYQTSEDPDDDRAPKYVVLPSGEKANRVLVSGTVTEIEDVGEDDTYLRARIVDGSGESSDENDGVFFIYAGQYQPDALAALEDIDTPEFVTVMGKPRTFTTEDDETGEEITFVSIRPEYVQTVAQADRDRWITEAAEDTLDRLDRLEDESDYEYVELAQEQYDVDTALLREGVKDSLRTAIDSDVANDGASGAGESE